jgi:hypothetical protein
MKKILPAFVLVGAILSASTSAFATLLYQEDWGTTNGGNVPAYALNAQGGDPQAPFDTVGWSIIVPSAQVGTGGSVGPYEGIYQEQGAFDNSTGYGLPLNTVYYTTLGAGETGFFYTVAGQGAGSAGDSSFPAGGISPGANPGLTFNAEVAGPTTVPNYFAVQVGGQWYVSATALTISGTTGGQQFSDVCLAYNPAKANWNTLSVSPPNTVTIGSGAGADLSGNITGFGIVEVGSAAEGSGYQGWDYNEVAITTSCGGLGVPAVPVSITGQPLAQTVYAGGGVSFVVATSGTQPISYTWYQGSTPLVNGGRISGANSATLTITNVNATDGTFTYSVKVSNNGGVNTQTSSAVGLTVNTPASDILYAETVPYVGATGAGNLGLGTLGWGLAGINGGIYNNGGGTGAVFAYTGGTDASLFYTDYTTDTNQDGLAFPIITIGANPFIDLVAQIDPNSVVTDVHAYFAVEIQNAGLTVSNWYVYGTPIDVNLSDASVFQNQQLQFTTDATKWDHLTYTSSGATIGSQATGTFSGKITGAGLVFTFNGGGGDFNWNLFEVTTDQVQAQPPVIGDTGIPWSQAVDSGGGASFQVTTQSGTQPFTYSWTLNGNTLHDGALADGAVVSGSTTPTLTLAGVTTAESGGNGNSYDVVAFVHNGQGTDESDSGAYFGPGSTTLTVNNPTIGTIYDETFPFIAPSASGNYAVSQDGWVEAYTQTPASLYDTTGSSGDGAVFVYSGSAITVAYYADTLSDTNQAGLPFPNIDPKGYTPGSLQFGVDLEGGGGSGNVTTYWAVAMTPKPGVTNWYCSSTPLPAPGGSFVTDTLTFTTAASSWNNLTVTPSGAAIGSAASAPLSGYITGAGLVCSVNSSGGDINFDNFTINGTGPGNIVVTGTTASTMTLSWVGNPAVQLQSATTLTGAGGGNWANVTPSTLGKYSTTVSTSSGIKYYRLVGPVSAE